MTDFNHVATHIIKESINSAIFIDDKTWTSFEDKGVYHDHSLLYESFKANNCILDINRYSSGQREFYPKLLAGKDLLILDWHLNDDLDDLVPTFEILTEATKLSNLHFCVIYTDQKDADLLERVILNIASYYSGLQQELCDTVRQEFISLLDSSGAAQTEVNKIIEMIRKEGKELYFSSSNKEKSKEILVRIDNALTEIGGKRVLIDFLKGFELPQPEFFGKLICLSFILNNLKVPVTSQQIDMKIFEDKGSIQLGNLLIKAFNKDSIKDPDLYNSFTQSLISESNIFLTLLGLEIRNRLRENSGFIGNDLEDIDHLAFFHHRNTHFTDDTGKIENELFNEFLKDIWKDQISSFLMDKELKLFNVLEEFKSLRSVDSALSKFLPSDEKSQNAIAKLNWVYNRLAIERKQDAHIRFGDIFTFDNEGIPVYLICITPVCDCLRPQKIKNNFFFVEGKDIGISRGVQKTDGDFVSFIKKADKMGTCIDWTKDEDDCKPFTLYIQDNHIRSVDKTIEFNYHGKSSKAKYVCTLKENYAQRIANRAFFYPLRVGINFASFATS